MRANVGQANSSGALPVISTRRSRPMARCCLASSSSLTVSLTAKNSSPREASDRSVLLVTALQLWHGNECSADMSAVS